MLNLLKLKAPETGRALAREVLASWSVDWEHSPKETDRRVTEHARSIIGSLHWPLRRLALCLDCDECFELGLRACPACSSQTWTTLSRFLEITSPERVARSAMRVADQRTPAEREKEHQVLRHLLVVARDHIKLYEHLRRTLAGSQSVQVVLDRRGRERRQGKGQPAIDRRRGDRRARRSIDDDEQLSAVGWSLVLLDLGKPRVTRPAL